MRWEVGRCPVACSFQLSSTLRTQAVLMSSLWPLLAGCFPVSLPILGPGTLCHQEDSHKVSPHSIPTGNGRGQMHFQSLPVGLSFSPIWLLWSKKFRVSPVVPASILPWLVGCRERKSNQAWLSTAATSKPHLACGYHFPESCNPWLLPARGFKGKSVAEVTELLRQRNHKAHKGTPHP